MNAARPGKFRSLLPGDGWIALFSYSAPTDEKHLGFHAPVVAFGLRLDEYDTDEIVPLVCLDSGIEPADTCADFMGIVRPEHIPATHMAPSLPDGITRDAEQ